MDLCTVLVVDNEPYSLVWMKHSFHQPALGFEVVETAPSALKAIDIIRKNPPDLIISDICMPEMNGIELLQYLTREKVPSKVVLVSAFADFSYAQEALHFGALDYLLKPVVGEAVQRVFEKAYQVLRPSEEVIMPQEETDDAYTLMLRYIQKNYGSQIRLQDLADYVHLNSNYCSILFQKKSGIPFSQYLIELRMTKAQELLKCKSITINQVASMVGYPDLFYFSKAFKQKYGVSPNKYRQNDLLMKRRGCTL